VDWAFYIKATGWCKRLGLRITGLSQDVLLFAV